MADVKGHIFVDFETRSRRSLDGGSFKYAVDESTEILLIGYCVEDQDPICFEPSDRKQREKFFQYLRSGFVVVAHNFLFEIPIIKYQGHRYEWPATPLSQYRCTMQMAGRAGLPLALEYAAKALELDQEKLDFGILLIHRFSIPQSNGEFIEMSSDPVGRKQFMVYCAEDAVISREIWRNLPPWTESEQQDVLFDLENNVRGVPIDVEASKIIHERVVEEIGRSGNRLGLITKGLITKPTQVQRIKQWVQRYVNSEIPSCDASHIERILAGEFGEVDTATRSILEIRLHSGKSSTAKYVKYIECAHGYRVRGMQISFGAHTGRPISKLLNLYNLPKPSIKYESMEELVHELTTGHKYDDDYIKAASTAIRGMVRAPKEKIICTADYAAIEARIVFWISGCILGLNGYREGKDQYVELARDIYPGSRIGEDERWVGKQGILGCGYGLGAKGFVNSCARWGVEVSLQLAETSVYAYRNKFYEVVEAWNDIEEAALSACRTGKAVPCCNGKITFKTRRTPSGVIMLHCKLPSGRLLTYPHVKLAVVTTPWGEKKTAVTYRKTLDRGVFRDSTYGGKLMENVCQAIARDVMYYGAQQAAKEGYEVLFTVYDEVIALHDKDTADMERFCELLCTNPDWATDLPLSADGKLQMRYEKL